MHRITLLAGRPDRTSAQFDEHWKGPHARAVLKLPGLRSYLQNTVIAHSLSDEFPFQLSGIVETWYDSIAPNGSNIPMTDEIRQWLDDELSFLSGLTGFGIRAEQDHSPQVAWKVWVLSSADADGLGSSPMLADFEARHRDHEEPVMTRDALGVFPDPVETVLTRAFDSESAARKRYESLVRVAPECQSGCTIVLTTSRQIL